MVLDHLDSDTESVNSSPSAIPTEGVSTDVHFPDNTDLGNSPATIYREAIQNHGQQTDLVEKSLRRVLTPEQQTLSRKEHMRIQLKEDVIQRLRREHPLIQEIDTTTQRQIAGTMLRNPDLSSVIRRWRSIKATTERQKEIRSLSDADIEYLYTATRDELQTQKTIAPELLANLHGEKGQITWNDRHELRQKDKRSLERIAKEGVVIQLDPQYVEEIKLAFQNYTYDCPILERLKNEKIFSINNLINSKTSLTIHDLYDHFWLFSKLQEVGILDQYEALMQRIGNPHQTDIYKRESELIATISFGRRLYKNSEEDFVPIFNLDRIQRVLSKSIKNDVQPSQNQQRALDLIQSIDPKSDEGKSLSYVISNMAIELMEQRRKHGSIKNLDENYQPTGVLKVLDPEYIAFIIETHHLILSPETKAEDYLLKIDMIVEEYLHDLTTNPNPQDVPPLAVTQDRIENYNIEQSPIPVTRKNWLKEDRYFAATKNRLC